MINRTTEKRFLGVCMVQGCVTEKAFYYNRQVLSLAKQQDNLKSLHESVLSELIKDINNAQAISGVLYSVLLSYKHFVNSPRIYGMIESYVEQGLSLQLAVDETFAVLIMQISDCATFDATGEIKDIYLRYNRAMGFDVKPTELTGDAILITEDLQVSDFLFLPLSKIKGIILTGGSRTSHIVEIAQSLNIPIVIQCSIALLSLPLPYKISLHNSAITAY